MKKFSQTKIGNLISKIIDIRRWSDWSRVKGYTLYLANGFNRLFLPQKETHAESFEEAKTKLNLSDESMIVKQKALFRLSLTMVITAFLILIIS